MRFRDGQGPNVMSQGGWWCCFITEGCGGHPSLGSERMLGEGFALLEVIAPAVWAFIVSLLPLKSVSDGRDDDNSERGVVLDLYLYELDENLNVLAIKGGLLCKKWKLYCLHKMNLWCVKLRNYCNDQYSNVDKKQSSIWTRPYRKMITIHLTRKFQSWTWQFVEKSSCPRCRLQQPTIFLPVTLL